MKLLSQSVKTLFLLGSVTKAQDVFNDSVNFLNEMTQEEGANMVHLNLNKKAKTMEPGQYETSEIR